MIKQELAKRVQTLQSRIEAAELDAYVVYSGDNIWYLSGVTYKPEERPFFIVVKPRGKPTLVVPKLEEAHLAKTQLDCSIVSYWEYPSPAGSNWYDALAGQLGRKARVGVESDLPSDVLGEILAEKIVRTDLVRDLRKVKSRFELDAIRRTAAVCDKAMAGIFRSVYTGASVVEPFTLSKSIQTKLIQSGEYDPIATSLLTAVWPAPASAMPHSIPGLGDRMGKGPNVAMCYFRINGYAAECERTFFLGKPDAEDQDRFRDMMEARKRVFGVLKAGVRCSDIDAEAKSFLVGRGYAENLLHRTGHGIGLGNHEEPWLAEGGDDVLAENMVVSVEPGLYFHGVGGYRHSDTVLVTKEGFEKLTGFPVELEGVSIRTHNAAARLKGALIRRALNL